MKDGQEMAEKATSFGDYNNNDNVAFIFDAKPSFTDPWRIAVALSDGSVRSSNVLDLQLFRYASVDRENYV